MFTKFSVLAAVVSFGLFVGGCASETNDNAESSDSAESTATPTITPGTFDLYNAPNTPSAGCTVKAVLTLTIDGSTAHASLKNVASGICAVYVVPDVRQYDLQLEGNSCGSATFTGEAIVNGVERHITITDNRSRVCKDIVPAKIVVDETDATNESVKRYTQS